MPIIQRWFAITNLPRSRFPFSSAVHHAEIIRVLPIFDRPIGLGDTHLLPSITEQGEAAAEAQIPYLRQLLSGPER